MLGGIGSTIGSAPLGKNGHSDRAQEDRRRADGEFRTSGITCEANGGDWIRGSRSGDTGYGPNTAWVPGHCDR